MLKSPLILTALTPEEPMLLYILATTQVVSAALVVEREDLVVDQVMKDKTCLDPKMEAYCQAVRDLEGKFHSLELHHVLRDHNKAANILAETASSRSRCLTRSSRVINMHPPYERRGRRDPRSRNPKS
jgi:hypothetical protein